MAVAHDVSQWIRRHCPSPCNEARPDHFPHAGGSASSHFPSPSGMQGRRSPQTTRAHPAHSVASSGRRTPSQDWSVNAQDTAGTSGKGADCPITALVGDSDGASRAI